ncbi:MAG: exopolysaccharide biosynthesis protein [Burkholderiaceae bacterium]
MARPQTSDKYRLSDVLDRMRAAEEHDGKIALSAVLQAVGDRSFGMAILVLALMMVSPLSAVPGLPSVLGIGILVTAAQMLVGRHHFWLPQWLLRRSVDADRARTAIGWLQRPARWIERVSHPRLRLLTRGLGSRVSAAVCLVLALAIPPLDLVPTANTITGIAISMIALSLILDDGLFLVIALLIVIGGAAAAAVAFF